MIELDIKTIGWIIATVLVVKVSFALDFHKLGENRRKRRLREYRRRCTHLTIYPTSDGLYFSFPLVWQSPHHSVCARCGATILTAEFHMYLANTSVDKLLRDQLRSMKHLAKLMKKL